MPQKRKRRKRSPLTKYLCISSIIVTALVLFLIRFIDILPNNYFFILTGLFATINIIFLCLLFSKSPIVSGFGKFFTAIYMILMIIATLYELNTIDFLKKIGNSEYVTLNYNVVVLKSSDYKKINDIKGQKVGITSNCKEEVTNKLLKKVDVKFTSVTNYTQLVDKLFDRTLNIILLDDSELEILNEENPLFEDKAQVLYEFSVDIKQKSIKDKADITEEPFNVFISGIDTYGSVNSASRSDVNIVMTVNPKEGKIILTSIPRDYYVKLHDINEYDKLTHAGIYGVESSVNTIEDLLGININYYVKLNFTSLVKTVDTLEGVEVDSKYQFTSQDGYRFTRGINKLNGVKALSFVRERKNLPYGDKSRGENQQALLSALINKGLSSDVLPKYNSLIKTLKSSFVTNFSTKEITTFIKNQIKTKTNWEIINVNLDGTDGYEYTYSYNKKKLYVMLPIEESVNEASAIINENFKK